MKKSAQRFWTVTAICGVTALLFLALAWRNMSLDSLMRLEAYTQDMRMVRGRKTPVDPRLVLIGIDRAEYSDFSDAELAADPTLKLLRKNYPWSRAVWADVITRLGQAGAKVIVLDLVFGAQGEGDDALKEALDKYKDQVVIGGNFQDFSSDRGDTMKLVLPNASVLNSSSSNLSGFDERVGFVNIWPDWDDVLRYARYRLEGSQTANVLPDGAVLESIDGRALRKFGAADLIPPGSEPIRFRYTAWGGVGYPAISLGDVLGPKTWKQNFKNGEFFRGKIVMVGPTADIFQDAHATPFPERDLVVDGIKVHASRLMPGPEIHLNMIAAALHQTFFRDTALYQNQLIILLAGLIATALSFLVHQPLRRLAVIILLGVAYWYTGQWLFDHSALVVPVASPLLVLTLTGVFVLTYDYFVQQFERTRVRKTLERYVSKNIVKELLDNPATYHNTLGGVRKPVTILFSDLRGFTTMTEHSEVTQLVKQLNEYLQAMTQKVFQFEGTLDKFIGDAVMAEWGNIMTHGPAQDAQNAVAAALAMKHSLAQLNADWKARGMPELSFGIGINHGEVVVGNMGSAEKMEMTVIGDAVNLASRLEGLTKWFHVDLLVGETVAPLVRERFVLRTVGLILAKGKTKPSQVFTVLGERGAGTTPDAKSESWLAEYEAGVKLYLAREFTEALRRFDHCRREKPDDYLVTRYCAECDTLIKHPPAAEWNGVFVMTEK